MRDLSVVGVDLAGNEDRPTGLCFLTGKKFTTRVAYGDEEILEEIVSFNPMVVAIDAPLSLPIGKTLDSRYCIRKCDEELRKFGIKFFSLNFAGMRKLTIRGIRLRKTLEEKGVKVIETYPGAFYDLMGLSRPKNKKERRQVLKALIKGFGLNDPINDLSSHELDSIVCALVGLLYLEGKVILLGDPKEGIMVLPRLS
ncbi:MAG: DUF429 domain-containing protein [Thermoproteota archaeon]|nr:MAG: DUF429 domain-containing protein [Candidatus Korarchaeota archaeon]